MRSSSLVRYVRSVLIVVIVSNVSGCVESSFELAGESRLPSWFSVPEGLKRSDLKVTLDYYTNGDSVFRLYRKGHLGAIDEVTGVMRDDTPLEKDGTSWPVGEMPEYPLYEIIIFQGFAQIIEHRRMEPVFYISDDPQIAQALGCAGDRAGMYKCQPKIIEE